MSTAKIDEYIEDARAFEERQRIAERFIRERIEMVADVVHDVKKALGINKHAVLPHGLGWTQATASWTIMPWISTTPDYIGVSRDGKGINFVASKEWFTDHIPYETVEEMVKDCFRKQMLERVVKSDIPRLEGAVRDGQETIDRVEGGENVRAKDIWLLFNEKRVNELVRDREKALKALNIVRQNREEWLKKFRAYRDLIEASTGEEWYNHVMSIAANERAHYLP